MPECKKCNKTVPYTAKFCVHCGTPMENYTVATSICPKCKNEVSAKAKYCNFCGYNIREEGKDKEYAERVQDEAEYPQATGPLYWKRDANSFAIRKPILVNDRVFNSGVIVDPGTQAVIISDGIIQGVVESGKYTPEIIQAASPEKKNGSSLLKNIWKNIKLYFSTKQSNPEFKYPYIYVLLIDSSYSKINSIELKKLRTKDPINIDCDLSSVVALTDPMKFFVNFMKSKDKIENSDLMEFLREILSSKMKFLTQKYLFEDLISKEEYQRQLTEELILSVNNSLIDYGIHIVRIVDFILVQEGMDNVYNLKSDNVIFKATAAVELDRDSLQQDVEFDKEKLELSDLERRQSVFESLLNSRNLKKITEIKSQEEMNDFLLEIQKNGKLRESEFMLFQKLLEEKEEDRGKSVEHLRKILELTRDQEKEKLKREHARTNLEDDMQVESKVKQHEIETSKLDEQKEDIKFSSQLERDKKIQEYEKQKKLDEIETKKHEDDIDFARFKEMQDMKRTRLDAEHKRDMEKFVTDKEFEIERQKLDVDVKKSEIEKDKVIGLANAQSNKEMHEEKEKLQKEFLDIVRGDTDKNLDRMERMFHSMTGTVGKQMEEREKLVTKNAEKIENMSKETMDRVTHVSDSKAANPGPLIQQNLAKTTTCPVCKEEVVVAKFCEKCGNQLNN